MHLIRRRYSRSGYAPPWFYVLMCSGFVALAIWAATQGDWIVAAIALAMIPVTIGGSRIMRRLNVASAESRLLSDASAESRLLSDASAASRRAMLDADRKGKDENDGR